ncbi:ReO_6 protein [Elysia marginata]|uniref:ReO_6 protein n=1 Tax=Elysia marginata TaxID=1093978 RepID=A0AAV4G242_9GAST|nr:ReO_6 protein [Elysia marginata]
MTNIINDQQEKSPDSVILVTGDFNHHTLEKDLTNFHQYIDCPTRGINTLDLCYGNVKKAYTCKQLAKLGESDHNMIQLIPKYRSVLKSVKPVHKTVNIYNEESIRALQACLDCTDWGVFVDSCEDLEELKDVERNKTRLMSPETSASSYEHDKQQELQTVEWTCSSTERHSE